LIEGESIYDAYDLAKEIAIAYVSQTKFLNQTNIHDSLPLLKGKGVILLPQDAARHRQVLYQPQSLTDGQVIVVNEKKNTRVVLGDPGVNGNPIKPFLSTRKKTFYRIYNSICKNAWFFLIHGKDAKGKSLFAKRLSWFIAER
jgi:hypothetical protein